MTIPKILVNGAQGKMGSLAVETINNCKDLKLAGTTNRKDNLSEAINKYNPDIVLDLTNANSVFQNTLDILNSGKIPVIGTSGLTDEHLSEIKSIIKNKNLKCLIVPNFSISAVLMMHISSIAAKHFSDINIIEKHHRTKIDAPSGTAIRTADLIAENLNKNNIDNKNKDNKNKDYKEIIPNALGATYKDINIHSIRQNGALAYQSVTFANQYETFEITQNSMDRQCFMPGVILACKKSLEINGLAIGLESLIL